MEESVGGGFGENKTVRRVEQSLLDPKKAYAVSIVLGQIRVRIVLYCIVYYSMENYRIAL